MDIRSKKSGVFMGSLVNAGDEVTHAMLYCTVLYSTLLYSTLLYSIVISSSVLYCLVLSCSTISFSGLSIFELFHSLLTSPVYNRYRHVHH